MIFPVAGIDDFSKIVKAFQDAKARDFRELMESKNKHLIPNKPGFYMFTSDDKKNDILYIGISTCLRDRFAKYKYTGSTKPNRTSDNLIKMRQMNYLEYGKEQDRLYLTCVVYENLGIEKRLIEKYRPRYDIKSEHQIGKMLNDALKENK